MSRIILINPNSTEAMTEAMVQAAQESAPSLAFEGWTSHLGPPSIQGEADGAAASPPLLDLVREAGKAKAAGIIIGCFDDTALAEARALAPCPVIGIGQASYHYAALRGWRFSVVTTLAVSLPVLNANIQNLGLARFLGRVRASGVPVLALEEDQYQAENVILEEATRAHREDSVDAIILGCGGMVHVTRALREDLPIPVIDPVETAARSMNWLSTAVVSR